MKKTEHMAQYIQTMLNRVKLETELLSKACTSKGINIEKWRALAALAHGNESTMGELSEGSGLAYTTLSRMKPVLVESGYIKPVLSHSNTAPVKITRKGLKLLADIEKSL